MVVSDWRLRPGLFCTLICAFGLTGPSALLAADPITPIENQLRSFATLGTVLHVAAHPDDENTQLITYFSRGRGYRTAYLSLTRGDGGQNELGRDFDERLGVARTQELLAARQLDGGRQFFTRAIDFGYSKSADETMRFWDRKEVLGDVVRIIRQFRPDVIVTRFPIPPGSGGHGHHTASAILAVEAFKLAGDPAAYPEQLTQGLTVWSPTRIVWNGSSGGRGSGGLKGPTTQLDIAGTDPVTGEAFGTIANRSRGMHKTQGLGGFSGRTATGPSIQTFMLLDGTPATTDLMDGVELTWARYPGGAEIAQLTTEAQAKFNPSKPTASVPALLAIRAKLAALPTDPLVTDKRAQLDQMIRTLIGLEIESTVKQAEAIPGETLDLHYAIVLRNDDVPVQHLAVRVPALRDVTRPAAAPNNFSAGYIYTGNFTGALPITTPVTQPYWLRADGAAGISRVDDPTLIGRPENPAPVLIEYVFKIGGQDFTFTEEPKAIAQDTQGERKQRLRVIPPVTITFNSDIFYLAPGQTKTVGIKLSTARANTRGNLRLDAPAGWQVTPATAYFNPASVMDTTHLKFAVTAPLTKTDGGNLLNAVALIDGQSYSNQRSEVRYDHLPTQLLQPAARSRAISFPLAVKGLKVGYLPGAGDSVVESLLQMGYSLRPLTGADLSPEKLQDLDAVIIGVRAFNERTDLKAALPGLFAWVETGGTVIAQYNRPNGLNATPLGPYELSIDGSAPDWRVTDERSPVTFIAPDHPVLNTPNKITPADFDGWVQERGAYFPSAWDQQHYTAILGMNDPGEKTLTSSLLIAKHGKGHYVYTGLGFFRQLPAGVPGAYRLLANLIALGK